MKNLLYLGVSALLLFLAGSSPHWFSSCRSASQNAAQQGTPYVVVVSMDGFRYDYLDWYDTPHLDSLGQEGVFGRMKPSYPSKTFPNHYTICTGLVPDHHGILANRFPDRARNRFFNIRVDSVKFDGSFYGGEPLWITSQRQGVKAGIVYWPGSDTEIKGVRPTYYHPYDKHLLTFEERIAEVQRYLTLPQTERPHLVMCYFSEPDQQGHKHGPSAVETRLATQHVDSCIGAIYNMLQSLDIRDSINLIVLSDHGMADCGPDRFVDVLQYARKEWIARADYTVPAQVDAAPGCADSLYAALQQMPHATVWRRGELPARLRYGTNPNAGDFIIEPELGYNVGEVAFSDDPGQHGFDPDHPEMQVPFIAIGPAFRTRHHIDSLFQNTTVYPLVCHLLHIQPADSIDGALMPEMLR